MDELSIIVTSDGSNSLLNRTLNETYHSQHGAVRESMHVFVAGGLRHALETSDRPALDIFELGFGTGLNALLTANEVANSGRVVTYTTVECFPLPESVWSALNYATSPGDRRIFEALHRGRWDAVEEIITGFRLWKIKGDIRDVALPPDSFDVIYFDAFAPSKQPELWEMTVLEKVVRSMRAGAVFVTYSARGQLRRDLRELGLTVERLPGPPGKKEMTRAVKRR